MASTHRAASRQNRVLSTGLIAAKKQGAMRLTLYVSSVFAPLSKAASFQSDRESEKSGVGVLQAS